MSLRRLGPSAKDQVAINDGRRSAAERLLNEIQRLNDYLSLMTNEPDPPTEESTSDDST